MKWKWLAAAAWVSTGLYIGCAAGGETAPDDDTSSNNTTNGNGGAGGSTVTVGPGSGGSGGDPSCAQFSAEAEQKPAALLIVLDASASMGTAGKWAAAQLAVVNAIDKDVFDTMSLGLVTFPSGIVDPPQCLCNQIGTPDINQCKQLLQLAIGVPGVSCGVSALPQVAMAEAGMDKSNAGTGVRSGIYNYLVSHQLVSNQDDGSPIYEAMLAGYNALKAYPNVDRRILALITDGGFSCTSLSNPQRPAFTDANNCMDWEHPDSVNQLIADQRNDPNAPVNTFVVGVPGSDTNGGQSGSFDNAPYPMRLALSTYAVSGSPETVDPACDSGATFSQTGSDPAVPCHLDLSNGQQFDANALADAIAAIRGQALGCVYPLPDPPPGETIDPDRVNVITTIDGAESTLPRRSDPNDECLTDGCWDYNTDGEVEILGKACEDISAATAARVDIQVGCETIVK